MSSYRAYQGPALLSFGFRPFFLGAGAWAALALPIWLMVLFSGAEVGGLAGRDWHVHEMLFGYLPAVAAGFLLTAVPNWTGRLPVTGAPLALLFGLWALGRFAMLAAVPLGLAAVVIDAAFLVVFAGVIWREIFSGKAWRNLPVGVLVGILALANIAFHLRLAWPVLGLAPERAALAGIAMLIALIGGRVTPSFTRNWMAQRQLIPEPATAGPFDAAVLIVTALALAAWVVLPLTIPTGGALALAGAANLGRLLRWRGWRTGPEPLVWSLHLGYGWLALAMMMLGGSILAPEFLPRSSGVHALTAGAVGVMTLAVMTRATLGHTGRARVADQQTLALYLLINAAAVARVAAPLIPEWQTPLLIIAGLLWTTSFVVFLWTYGPMLALPKALQAAA